MLRYVLMMSGALLLCLLVTGCGEGGNTSDPSQLPEGREPVEPDGNVTVGDTGADDVSQ